MKVTTIVRWREAQIKEGDEWFAGSLVGDLEKEESESRRGREEVKFWMVKRKKVCFGEWVQQRREQGKSTLEYEKEKSEKMPLLLFFVYERETKVSFYIYDFLTFVSKREKLGGNQL